MRAPEATDELRAALQQAAREELWRIGALRWKLHPDQREVYDAMMASAASRYVLEIARRYGKTFLLVVVALEACLRFPGSRVVFGAPTLKHLEEFVHPAFEKICADAPADCLPKFNSQKGHYEFPENGPARGSYVHLFGADTKQKANRGRGAEARVAIFDEAGFTPFLSYILRSIFRPQLLLPGEDKPGRTYIGSTPAEEPEHDFTAIAERAEANGNYANRTIYDNPRLTPQRIEQFIAEDAKEEGLTSEEYMKTDDFRREYLAERVVNKLLVAVPEWEEGRKTLIQPVKRPQYFRAQVTLDFGGADPHAVAFAYWHPAAGRKGDGAYVTEDELLMRDGESSAQVAEAVKAAEVRLYGAKKWDGTLAVLQEGTLQHLLDQLPTWMERVLYENAPQQPWSRIADNNLTLVRDLFELHGLAFVPTAKDQKQLQVNALRVLIREGAFLVTPNCVHTDRHLKQTTWKDHKRKEYARKGGEHGDLLDCAVYGVRNLDRRDPTPADAILVRHDATVGERLRVLQQKQDNLAEAFLGGTRLGRKLLGGKG